MSPGAVSESVFQEELQQLLAAAKGMTEGKFHQTVTVRTRGIVGELASYINRTLRNLQSLDPTVKGSSREIPKVAAHLTEIIRTTEEATNRVLEETEHLVEEQARVEQGLSRVREGLRHPAGRALLAELGSTLDEAREVHRRSQSRAMDIMAAMEFQDLTTQKIQKLIALVAEVEARLLQLLVLFRLEEAGSEPAADPILATCAQDGEALCDQELVDQLLAQFGTRDGPRDP